MSFRRNGPVYITPKSFPSGIDFGALKDIPRMPSEPEMRFHYGMDGSVITKWETPGWNTVSSRYTPHYDTSLLANAGLNISTRFTGRSWYYFARNKMQRKEDEYYSRIGIL